MHRLLMALVLLFIFSVSPGVAETSDQDREIIVADAREGLSEILQLWRNEMFEELYEHTYGNYIRYAFLERMVNSLRKPACCWEQLQDLSASQVSPERVTVIARIGMETDGAGIEFFTRSFELKKEADVWKIGMVDIISLAGSSTYRVQPRRIIERPVP